MRSMAPDEMEDAVHDAHAVLNISFTRLRRGRKRQQYISQNVVVAAGSLLKRSTRGYLPNGIGKCVGCSLHLFNQGEFKKWIDNAALKSCARRSDYLSYSGSEDAAAVEFTFKICEDVLHLDVALIQRLESFPAQSTYWIALSHARLGDPEKLKKRVRRVGALQC